MNRKQTARQKEIEANCLLLLSLVEDPYNKIDTFTIEQCRKALRRVRSYFGPIKVAPPRKKRD